MPSSAIERQALVIGYGNDLRGDDAAGPAAAQALAERLPPTQATVLIVHQLLPELADPISRATLVIFIDADDQLPPGEIHQQAIFPSDNASGSIGHHQTPQGILTLAKSVYGRAPQAFLFSIGGADFSYKQSLSPVVQNAMPQLLNDIERLIAGV